MAYRDLITYESVDKFRFSYDGNGNQEYIGQAAPGSSESDLVWKIRKFTYSGTSQTEVNWANGSPAYVFSWTDRTSYTYT